MKVAESKPVTHRPPAPIWIKKNKTEFGFKEILENVMKGVQK